MRKRWKVWSMIHAEQIANGLFWAGVAACLFGPVMGIIIHKGYLLLTVAGCFAINRAMKDM